MGANMNEHKFFELFSRVIFLIAMIVVFFDLTFWRP